MNDKAIFAAAFVEAALWADTPEDYEGNGSTIGLASDDAQAMRDFAGKFYDDNREAIEAYPEGLHQAGSDLWFTTAGHGVGYWEQSDDASQALDKAARAALPYNEGLYEGDDGLLYWLYRAA